MHCGREITKSESDLVNLIYVGSVESVLQIIPECYQMGLSFGNKVNLFGKIPVIFDRFGKTWFGRSERIW